MIRPLTLLACATLTLTAAEPVTFGPWSKVQMVDAKGPHDLAVSYYNLLADADGAPQLWFTANFRGTDSIIGLAGPDLGHLVGTLPRFDATIIQGYTADLLGRKTPIISRSSTTRLKDGTWVSLGGIGPEYGAGGKLTELYPALFTSPSGQAGTWTHAGTLTGEPAAVLDQLAKAKLLIRFEGGTILERPEGGLRLYCGWQQGQSGSLTLALLEAPAVAGPWTFVKDPRTKKPLDLATGLAKPGAKNGWLFPAATDLGPQGVLLTGGDTWPPTRIDAAWAADGLNFRPLGPILTAEQVLPGAKSLKSCRFLRREDGTLLAVANPHPPGSGNRESGMYPLYWATATLTLPTPPTPPKR